MWVIKLRVTPLWGPTGNGQHWHWHWHCQLPCNCIAESFEVAHAVFFTVFTGTEVATNKNAYMLPRGNLFEGFGRAYKLSILVSWGVVSHSIDIDMIDMTEIRWVDQRVRPYY